MTDRDLVRRAGRGDQEAFAELVRKYENQIFSLARRMCTDPDDAADVAQEAFLAAWKGLPNFRQEAEFSTWLYRLATNAAIDHLRKAKKQRGDLSLDDEALSLDTADSGPTPHQAAESRELRRAVSQAMDQLSDDHRQVLVLREVRQLSYEEIARALDMDLGTVKSRISRARNSLRKILLKSGNLSGYLPSNLGKHEREERR